MKCEYCNNEIPAGASKCPSCGAPAPQQVVQQAAPQAAPMPQGAQPTMQQPMYQAPVINIVNNQGGVYEETVAPAGPKSRLAYIALAVIVGALGLHNFYAGRTVFGVLQLALTVVTGGALAFVSWIWAVVEACTVKVDGEGVPFK